jgi:protein-S-isoprenylcysteine O-methyltransferase Ste14
MRLARGLLLIAMAMGTIPFIDALPLTLRQPFLARLDRPRTVLLAFELALIGAWGLFMFYLKWDVPLVRASLEVPAFALGGVLAMAGMALAAAGKLRLGRWFSATFGVKPGHELVTDGPYALVRHPIYAGLLAALLGASVAWNSLATLALAAALSVPLFFHTVYEERLFDAHFGPAYETYRRRVPRLIPRLR